MKLPLVLALLIAPAVAEASEAKIVISCARTTTIAVLDEVEETCLPGDEETWLDLSVSLDTVVFSLSRPRTYSVGLVPGVGWGFRWKPGWWTLSDAMLGIDLIVGGGFDIPDDSGPVAINVSTLLAVTIGNLFGVGAGFRYALGLGDREDDFVPIVSLGLRHSP